MRHANSFSASLVYLLLVTTGCSRTNDMIKPQGADGACSDSTGNRFVDCGNGTVTDTQTHLIWSKLADCFPTLPWPAAVDLVANEKAGDCNGTLMDHSSAGDWRMPTREEWQALVKPSCPPVGNTPLIPDKSGNGCYAGGPWAIRPLPEGYWSSSVAGNGDYVYADLGTGLVGTTPLGGPLNIWVLRN